MDTIIAEIQRNLPLTDESKRLFHGRGHRFPGFEDLQIDWFAPAILISLYAPRDNCWLDQLVVKLIQKISDLDIVLLQERYLKGAVINPLLGEVPPTLSAREYGLQYRLRLGEAQNIGFFPDMSRSRALVRRLVAKKKVLNLFAYSCSFSVAAIAGGAAQVVNVDMNRGALTLGQQNHQLNQLESRRASFLVLDILKSFKRLERLGPFELVICDPPAYQGKSFKAERDWPKLLRRLPKLLASGGDFIACLNGPHLPPEFLLKQVQESAPYLELQSQFQPGDNFPEAEASRGVWTFHYRG